MSSHLNMGCLTAYGLLCFLSLAFLYIANVNMDYECSLLIQEEGKPTKNSFHFKRFEPKKIQSFEKVMLAILNNFIKFKY